MLAIIHKTPALPLPSPDSGCPVGPVQLPCPPNCFCSAPYRPLSAALCYISSIYMFMYIYAAYGCDVLIELILLIQVARAANSQLMQINMRSERDQVRNMQKVELQQRSHHYALRISNECQPKDTHTHAARLLCA